MVFSFFRLYKCSFLSYLPKLRDFTLSTMGNIILKILDGKTFGFRFFWSPKLVKNDSYRVNYFLVRRTIFEFIFWLIYLILTFISTKKSWCMKSPIDLVWKRKNMWKKLLFGAYFGYLNGYWIGQDSILLTRWCSSVGRAFGLHTKSMGSIPGEMKKKYLEYFWATLS